MKKSFKVLFGLITLLFISRVYCSDLENPCPQRFSKLNEVAKVEREYFDEIRFFLGYDQVEWTVDDQFKGNKVILKLHTRAKSINANEDGKTAFDTKYVIADIDYAVSFGSDGVEYSSLEFTPITKIEALKLNKNDGIKIVKKVVSYAQFNLKKDLAIGQKLFASFEPVRNKITLGLAVTDKLQFNINAASAIGYSSAKSTNVNYTNVSNFYVGVKAGLSVIHRDYGTFSFDYAVNSGVVIQNVRPDSPQDTTRAGTVRATYRFKLAKNTECEVYAEKRSFQFNPSYNEETNEKQERLYEKAKTYGVGCEARF